MVPVQRKLLGLPLLAMLLSTASAEAKDCFLANTAGQLLSLLKMLESKASTIYLEPADLKTTIAVWPGLLEGYDLALPHPLTRMPPGQADFFGRSIRYITLHDAIAHALENGPIDRQTLAPTGTDVFPVDAAQTPCAKYTVCVEDRCFTRASGLPSRLAFERQVQLMHLNVECAYWNLQFGYRLLCAQEQGLRRAYETWKLAKLNYETGRGSSADLEMARGQYESFRRDRLLACNDVQDLERQFRALLDMKSDDWMRLVPSDQPTVRQLNLDWDASLHQAMSRPEIVIARQRFWIAQTVGCAEQTMVQCLDIFGFTVKPCKPCPAFYHWPPPDDPSPVPFVVVGAYENLRDQELKTHRFLAQGYRGVFVNSELIRAQRAAREAFAEQLKAKLEAYKRGTVALDAVLEAQRFWCDALSKEMEAIRDYNNALAQFEYRKGSILERNPAVTVADAVSSAP
jgi:hypothetical protein